MVTGGGAAGTTCANTQARRPRERPAGAGPSQEPQPRPRAIAGRGAGAAFCGALDAVEAARAKEEPGPAAGAVGGGRAPGPGR